MQIPKPCKAARRLRAWMIRHKWTQTAFAAHLGISQPALNSYLQGERRPSDLSARAIDLATDGEIPPLSWLTARERARYVAVESIRPANSKAA